jgi:hypothetical protein
MTEADLLAKWESQAAEYERLGISANAASLCRALLHDLSQVRAATENRVLSLVEAATWSGYSQAHLARLVKEGKVITLRSPGSRGRLTFRAGDLPRKPGAPHHWDAGAHELASRLYGGREGRHARA